MFKGDSDQNYTLKHNISTMKYKNSIYNTNSSKPKNSPMKKSKYQSPEKLTKKQLSIIRDFKSYSDQRKKQFYQTEINSSPENVAES